MVDRQNHDIVLRSQIGSIVESRAARTNAEVASVQPDHHRPLPTAAQIRSPHVQNQTVFTQVPRSRQATPESAVIQNLWGWRSHLERVAYTGPRVWRHGRLET